MRAGRREIRYAPARTTPRLFAHLRPAFKSLEPELTPASPDPAPRVSQPRTPRHAREHAPTPPGEWVTGRRGTRPVTSPDFDPRDVAAGTGNWGMLTPTFDDRFNTPEGSWLTGPADFAGISGGPRSVAQPVRAPRPARATPKPGTTPGSSRRVDSSLRREASVSAAAAAHTGSFAFGRYRSGLDEDDAGSNVGSSSKPSVGGADGGSTRGAAWDVVARSEDGPATVRKSPNARASAEFQSSPDMKVRLSAAMEALRNVRTELEEKETSLGDSLAESRAMLMIANQDLDEARRLNGTLERESEDAKGRADALRKALTDALAKVESQARESAAAAAAAARLSAAEDATERAEAENRKLREALDQSESRLADAERARKDAEEEAERRVDSIADVENELDAARAEIDGRVSRERELADQIERLCEALLISESAEGKTAGVDGAMSVEVARLRQELRKSEKYLRDASTRAETSGFRRAEAIAALEERAERAEVERDRLESMMRPMRDELERLTAIVNEQTASTAGASAARERDVLLAELESQKEIVRAAMSDAARSRGGGANSGVDLEKLEEDLRVAEAALVSSRAAERVASIEAEAARAEAAKRVENEREAARREQERAAKEHESMADKLGESRADAAEATRRADDLAARVQALEARCSAAESARDEAAARFAAAAAGEENLAAQLRAAKEAAEARETELAEEVKTAKMTRLMFRWRNQATSHAFIAWRDNAADRARSRRVAEKVAGRWRRVQLSVPFNDWLDFVASVKEERRRLRLEETEARAGASEREAGEFRTQAERLVAEVSELKTRAADAEAALERATMDVSVATSRISQLEAEKEERDRKRTLENEAGENNIRYLANQLKTAEKDAAALKQAVRDASANLEESAAELERAKAAAAEREAELGARLATAEKDSSSLKLAVRDAASKFDDATAELGRVKAAAEARETELAEEVKTAKMTRLMYRWRNQSTSHAFVAWRDNVREIARVRRVLEKVTARWRRLEMSVPFDRWVEWTRAAIDARREEELERTKEDADTIRVEAEKLVAELGKFKAKARDAEESAAANEKLAKDAAAEIEKRRLSADAAEESMFKELERQKAVADDAVRQVARLEALRNSETAELREKIATLETAEREAVERFAAAAANETKLARALRDANDAANAREDELAEELRFAKLARLVHRWRNQAASRAFAAWRRNAREAARRRRAVSKVATRWKRLALAVPFDDWLAFVDEARETRRAAEIVEHETQAERLVEELAAAATARARLEEEAAELRRRCEILDGREAEAKRAADVASRDAAELRLRCEKLDAELTEVRAKLRRSENAARIDATLGGHTPRGGRVTTPAPRASPAPHADSDTDSNFSESEASVPGPATRRASAASPSPAASEPVNADAVMSDSVTSWTPFRVPARSVGVGGGGARGHKRGAMGGPGGATAVRVVAAGAWIAAFVALIVFAWATMYMGDAGGSCTAGGGGGAVAWTAGVLDELLSGTVRARYRPACGVARRPS